MLENPRISPQDIREGPFKETQRRAAGRERVLLIQDSTAVKAEHPTLLREVQGRGLGGANGFCAHHGIAVDGVSGEVLGLVDQMFWLGSADKKPFRTVSARKKESEKWPLCWENCKKRLGPDLITVADREADDWAFLALLRDNHQRFVIRSRFNRKVDGPSEYLRKAVTKASVMGSRTILIEQRGGQNNTKTQAARTSRKRSSVPCKVQVASVEVKPPAHLGQQETFELNVVRVSYQPSTKSKLEPLEWILLTSEPVKSLEQACQIVKDYENRWLIEEFHKCWKSGCKADKRPFQTISSMQKMMVITSAIAVNLLQLRAIAHGQLGSRPCSDFLSSEEWQCLWDAVEQKSRPKRPPTAKWAAFALAKLGAWYDTKGTGKIGWETMWYGWRQLEGKIGGYSLAKRVYGISEEM